MGREAVERQEKTRICIRIDTDLVEYFKKEAAMSVTAEDGPVGYQTLISEALREYIDIQEALGNIVRERAGVNA